MTSTPLTCCRRKQHRQCWQRREALTAVAVRSMTTAQQLPSTRGRFKPLLTTYWAGWAMTQRCLTCWPALRRAQRRSCRRRCFAALMVAQPCCRGAYFLMHWIASLPPWQPCTARHWRTGPPYGGSYRVHRQRRRQLLPSACALRCTQRRPSLPRLQRLRRQVPRRRRAWTRWRAAMHGQRSWRRSTRHRACCSASAKEHSEIESDGAIERSMDCAFFERE